jgi:hypothetical protein
VQRILEESDYPVLHISHVGLPKTASANKAYLQASTDKDVTNLTLACLTKDKLDTQSLDLYFNVNQKVTLTVTGSAEIHLSGYFEPNREEMDDEGMMFDDADEEDDEDFEEEVAVKGGKLDKNLKQAQQNALKNSALTKKGAAAKVESDDDEDDEDLDDDEELSEDEDSEEENLKHKVAQKKPVQ